jgi:hypothetical protein
MTIGGLSQMKFVPPLICTVWPVMNALPITISTACAT